ncbi:MAG: class I SAM-dependent methyltransferase [Thermodesulfovibrionales bacterium]
MKRIDSFDPSLFKTIREAEKKHFWFNARRKWIFDKVKKFIPPPANFLEVGCGSGNVSNFLSQKGYKVTGCEYYSEALNIAYAGFLKVQGNADNLPFKDNTFDIVGLFDVIEHLQDDITPLKQAVRVLKKNGIIVVTVPAREELWSWFDEMSSHKRRYTIKMIKNILIAKMNLKLLLAEYMFMSLYVPLKFIRRQHQKDNELFRINEVANVLLKSFFHIERFLSKMFPLPIGTSLIAIAQKVVVLISFILYSVIVSKLVYL